jgi:CubicO group peptidase (beta-lactamase class C family)
MLKRWKVPASEFTKEGGPTLRQALSHTGGFSVHGFMGYERGTRVPSAVEVLEGKGNSKAVVVELKPGTKYQYSGGGYTAVQVMVEDVTGEGFAEVVGKSVLSPLGMTESGYEPPAKGSVAGHNRGTELAGGWVTHPERAAAALWTTPTDLAKFVIAIQKMANGEDGILQAVTVKEMLREQLKGDLYGLGFQLQGEERKLKFFHGGRNQGFDCVMVAFPATGQGAVIMINANENSAMVEELTTDLSEEYGWPE